MVRLASSNKVCLRFFRELWTRVANVKRLPWRILYLGGNPCGPYRTLLQPNEIGAPGLRSFPL